jgi:hypothetical protein
MENVIQNQNIFDIEIYMDGQTRIGIFDSEIKLAQMGRLRPIKNKCKMIKKLVKQKCFDIMTKYG